MAEMAHIITLIRPGKLVTERLARGLLGMGSTRQFRHLPNFAVVARFSDAPRGEAPVVARCCAGPEELDASNGCLVFRGPR